jgi:hypothetical protein
VVEGDIIKVIGDNPSSRFRTRSKPSDFSGRKNPQYAFIRRGSKAVLSHVADLRHVKDPYDVPWKSVSSAEFTGQFSPTKFHLSLLGALASCGRGGTWRWKLECSKLGVFRVAQ